MVNERLKDQEFLLGAPGFSVGIGAFVGSSGAKLDGAEEGWIVYVSEEDDGTIVDATVLEVAVEEVSCSGDSLVPIFSPVVVTGCCVV